MQQEKRRDRKFNLKLMTRMVAFGLFCVAMILSGLFFDKGLAQKFNIDDALFSSLSPQVSGIDSVLDSPQASPSSSPALFKGFGPHIESTDIAISGTVWTDELKGSTIGAGKNISLAVNGGAKTTVATIGAGTFSFTPITVTAGQPFVIFVDDGANHGNLISRAKETDITVLDMYTDHIVLRHEDGGPLTNANLGTAHIVDGEIKYSVDGSSNVSFDAGYKVWIESPMTYTPGANITTVDDLEVRTTGVLNSATNDITVTGTWKVSATGTLTITGGTVTFSPSAGTENIDTGGTDGNHDFYNVTKSGANTIKLYNGTSTVTSFSMKMGGTLTVSAGTFDANGRNLTMGVYSQTGGIFDADAANSGNNENTITCLGNFTINASLTYNARQSNLILDATAGDILFTGGGYTFNDVTFQNNSWSNARTITPAAGTYTLNGSLYGEANLQLDVTLAANTNNPSFVITGGIIYQGEGAGSESISMGTGSWTVQSGNIYLTDGTITAGSSTLTSNASGWQEVGEGTDSKVYALTSWTNGGTTYLVAGGSFKEIGSGTRALRLAAWDGSSWTEIGGGANMAVRALSVWSYGGTDYLAVAGNFTKVNDGATTANRIALWDGANWTTLGSGLNGIARALTVYNTNLVVGGNFTTAGGAAANYIAQWDGANWTTFGTGMSGGLFALTTWTYSATTYLVAGGEFVTAGGVTVNNIAKWDGAAWLAFANGMDDVTYHTVYALNVYSSNLVAGGDFTQVNGDASIKRVAQWSGVAWSAFGSGFGATVQALLVSGGNLYAGGWFRQSGGVPMKRIVKWNSGGGVWELVGEIGANKPVLSLTEWTYASVTYIVIGGNFYKVDGQLTRKIAKWNGSSWSSIGDGIEDPVRALTTYSGNLYLGGSFSDAGGVDADGIASWNGTSYADVGGGVNGSVYAMVAWSNGGTDYLAVGGTFTTAGATTVNRVALWDGANWTACGTGMNSTVYALRVWNGNLIAGGSFTTAGGGAANRLASWNGAAWSEVGGGVDDNSVRSLAVLGTNLEVGGNFTAVNVGTAMSRIGEWTGAAWNALGTGAASGNVYALTVSGTDLYAGGSFSGMGGVANTKYIAKWDGANWTAVGTGMDGGYVYSLSIFDSKLEAGGDFTTAGGVVARRAAEYGGGAWSPLGGGMDDNVYTLATYNNELYAGGLFATASGTLINRIAKWGTQKITTAAQSFNIVTFSASSTSNRKAIISGAFTIVGNLSISESSSGTLTLDLDTYDPAMTLTGTFAMGAGTAFLGGSSAITTSSTVSINGGAFTSTSNTFTVNNTFTRAAGATFTHNSGTFLFYADAAYTITANGCAFNNVTFDKTATTARIITFANGFTADGNLQVSNNASSPNSLSFYGTSNPIITVKGNVTFPATAATGVLVWGDTANNFSMDIKGNLLMQDGSVTYYPNTTMSGTADQGITISAGTISTGSWTINDPGHIVTLYTNVTTTGAATHLTLTDGTLALSTFTFSIGGNYSQTGGTFNGAPSGGLTLGASGTFALSVGTFNSPANLSVPGIFTLTSGTFVAPTGTLSIGGNYSQAAGTFGNPANAVTLTITGNYSQTGGTFNNLSGTLTFGAASTLTLQTGTPTFNSPANLSVPGAFTISTGTFVAPTGTLTINTTFTVAASPTATFTHRNGMVLFNAVSGYNITTNNISFYNVNINKASGTSAILTYYGSHTIEGNLQVTNNATAPGTLSVSGNATPIITINGNVTFPSTAATGMLAWGVTSNFSLAIKGNLSLLDSGVTYYTNTTMSSTAHNQALDVSTGTVSTGNWVINDSGYAVTLTGNLVPAGSSTFTLTAGGFDMQNNNINFGGAFVQTIGTFTQGNGTITIGGAFTVNNGTFNGGAGAITVTGAVTLSAGTFKSTSGTFTNNTTFSNSIACANFNNNSGTFKFLGEGSGGYNITTNGCTFKNVIFDKTQYISRILTLMDGFTVDGDLTVTNHDTTSSHNFTIAENASATITVSGNTSISNSGAGYLYWGTNTIMDLKGDLSITMSATASSLYYYASTTFSSTTHNQALTLTNAPTVSTGNWVINDSGWTVTLTGNLVPAGSATFTLTAGGFNMQNNNINFGGAFVQTTGTFTQGNGSITFGNDIVNASFTMNNGIFSGGAGNITTGDHGTVAINAGSFTSTSGIFKVKGAFTRAGGATFVHHGGTFKFYNWGTASYDITTNNCAFYNVIFGKDTGTGATVALLQDSFSVAGDITFQNEGTSNSYTLKSISSISPTISVTGSLSFPSAAGGDMKVGSNTDSENFSINLGGNLSTNDASAYLYTNITMNSTIANQSITTTAGTYGTISTGNWVIDNTGHAVTLMSNLTPSGVSTPNFTLTAGAFNMGNYNISFGGDFLMTNGTFTQGNGSITFGTIGGGSFIMNNGTFYGGAGAITTGYYEPVAINNGIFRSTSGNFTIKGDFTRAAPATFTHNSGTVTFDELGTGSIYYITTNNATFYNVVFTKDDILFGTDVVLLDGFTVEGDLTGKGENANNLTVRSTGSADPTITVNGILNFPTTGSTGNIYFGDADAAENFTVAVKGNITANDGDAFLYAHTQLISTTADQTITLTTIGGLGYGNWSITKGNYTAIQATSLTFTNGSGLAINSGAWYTGGLNLTVPGTFSNDGTFRLQGGEATLSFTRDTNSGTVEYVGDGLHADVYPSLKYDYIYWNLKINSTLGTDTWTSGAALDVNGPNGVNITRGTLDSNGFNITDAGNWGVTAPAGAFTAGVKKVTLDGTAAAQTVTCGGSSFYGLTVTNAFASGVTFAGPCTIHDFINQTSDGKMTFNATSAYTVTNMTFAGTSGHRLVLRSSVHPDQWFFNVSQANPAATYTDVEDSDAKDGSEIDCLVDCHNEGNNENWNFNAAPHNDSLTFNNPYGGAGNTAVADDTTPWDFEAKVTDTDGCSNIDYIELRLANSSGNAEIRYTRSTGLFTPIADPQLAFTIDGSSSASCASNQWTVNFKLKINDNFLNKDINYGGELYSIDNETNSDDDTYADFYQVTALYLTFTITGSPVTVNFGNLTPGIPIPAPATGIVTNVTTNAANGYTLSLHDSVAGSNSCLVKGGVYIPDFSGIIGVPTLWVDGTSIGLGITLYSCTTDPAHKDVKWGTGSTYNDLANKYAGIPTGATVANTVTGPHFGADVCSWAYKLDAAVTQETGAYSGTMTFTATSVI